MEDDNVELHGSDRDSRSEKNDDNHNEYEGDTKDENIGTEESTEEEGSDVGHTEHEGETKDEDSETEESVGETPEEDETHVEDTWTPGQIRHNLQPNRGQNYTNRLAHAMDNLANTQSYDTQLLQHDVSYEPMLRATVQEMKHTGLDANVFKYITGILMMQLTAKAGIKKHGQVALDALSKEFSQLHDLGVFLAQDRDKLTREEKRSALQAISMITEKQCGQIKGRTVAMEGHREHCMLRRKLPHPPYLLMPS